jgi:hypothetical protein
MKIKHTDDYAKRRKQEYPTIEDQLDALLKGFQELANGGMKLPPSIKAWVDQLQRVKDKFPKDKQ